MRLLVDLVELFFIFGGVVYLFRLSNKNKSMVTRIEKLEDKTKDLLSSD